MILHLSISIKDFVEKKKSATEKKKEPQEQFFMKLNTKPLKFKCGLADGGGGPGGGAGWSTHARHGYPHLVPNDLKYLQQTSNFWVAEACLVFIFSLYFKRSTISAVKSKQTFVTL